MNSNWQKLMATWNESWFSEVEPSRLASVRISAGLIASLHFVMLLMVGNEWLGPTGWFNRDVGYFLIGNEVDGTGSFYRWSLLYWLPDYVSYFAGIGFLASLATMAGIGSRLSPLLVWFCMGTFGNRAPLLTHLHEPLLVALMAYLTIEPGRLLWTFLPGYSSGLPRVSVCIVLQLIRFHFWIWIAFGLAGMLANPIWWNGDAGGFLLQHSRGLLHFTDGWQSLGQWMTHAVIAIQAAILLCMLQRDLVFLGRWLSYLFAGAVLLLTGDWMYASVILAASFAIWPVTIPHRSSMTV